MRLKTVPRLTNCLECSLIPFSSPGYYRLKKIKLVLEQYLKLDLWFESIAYYHCLILWLSWELIIWADKFVASEKYTSNNFHLDGQNHWCMLMVLNNKHWLFSEKPLLSLLAHFHSNINDSLLYTNKLSAFAKSWGYFRMFEKILNFSLFWEYFQNLNLPHFIKEGMVSIVLYLFEKPYLHVKLLI